MFISLEDAGTGEVEISYPTASGVRFEEDDMNVVRM